MSYCPLPVERPRWSTRRSAGLALLIILGAAVPGSAVQLHELKTRHVPAAVARLTPVGTLLGSEELKLALSLPLRNRAALDTLLQQLADPASPNYRRYLTPQQFAERFGATEKDYQSLIDFAQASGLKVTATHANRLVLSVAGSPAQRRVHAAARKANSCYQSVRGAHGVLAPPPKPLGDTP
jgi:hypothetical protein